MKDVLRKAIKTCYDKEMICFEHGQAGSCHWGKSYEKNEKTLCYHAHLHCLPVDIDIRNDIKKILPEEIIINSFDDLKYIRDMLIVRDSYLYFEDKNGIGYMYPVEDKSIIPRQFLRTCVANKIGIPERANWVEYPGIEFFEKTKKTLTQLDPNFLIK